MIEQGVTGLRGIWLGVRDFSATRAFYELLGARFNVEPLDGMMQATLGGVRLNFERGTGPAEGAGAFLLFDVADVDTLHNALGTRGYRVLGEPRDEPWGRQFNVLDPDGYPLAFIGPVAR